MQKYKVKLNDNHSAQADQNCDGYLGECNMMQIYDRKEALKKAILFGGVIEKHGKNYTVATLKTIRFLKSELGKNIIKQLQGREVYIDTDETLGESIYYGDVFAAIAGELTETIHITNTPEIIDELITLDNICANYDYVTIM